MSHLLAHANLHLASSEALQGVVMSMAMDYRKNTSARRYILRLNETGDGGRVTIPRGGSLTEARRFALRNLGWLEARLAKLKASTKAAQDQDAVLFRGELVPLWQAAPDGRLSLGASGITMDAKAGDWRRQLAEKLWELAARELPPRVAELAAVHDLKVNRVSVRNQKSRWGSCSTRRVISLNWRLVQTPEMVRDYIIVHELMHLRQMNHSKRYWKLVYEAFPQTDEAEKWLRKNGTLLRDWRRFGV